MATPDLQQALDRFKVGSDADVDQRNREVDALRFQVPELCWPTEVKDQRKPQLIGGVAIPQRPMLSIPSLDHPIQLVLNAEKAAHLGVSVHPLSDEASDDTVDYAIMLSGELVSILDEDETILRAGDVLIQRGTNHAWANRSGEMARIAFVLIDGKR